jgi:outer membrane protein assembly factor BamB
VFSSPSVAGDHVFVGVLNGTLESRDLNSGNLLWQFRTEASTRNEGWVLTAGALE